MRSALTLEDVATNILEMRKGSTIVEFSVAIQTKFPDGALQAIQENLLHSIRQKYNIQDLQIKRGNHLLLYNLLHNCMFACY